MPSKCIDWDDTLVGYKKYGTPGEWLPGAQDALRRLKKRGYVVIVHSCRASWPEGRAEIEAKLAEAGFRLGSKLQIEPKPLADEYIDDRATHFSGDWAGIELPPPKAR